MKKLSYKEIVSKIIELENKYDLFSLKQENVYIWKLIRMPLLNEIVLKNNNLLSVHGVDKMKDKSLGLKNLIKYSLFNNPFYIKRDTTNIIFENARKIEFEGESIDPYSHFFVKDIDNYHMIEEIHRLKRNKSFYSPSSTSHLFQLWYLFKNKISKKKNLSLENIHILLEIEKEIEVSLDIKISVNKLAYTLYNVFNTYYRIYNLFFRKKNFERIYIVCSYGREALIAAAQKNNIKVIEFQHGVMGPYHLGYHFPNNKRIAYFPDEIYLFGEFWRDSTSLPNNTYSFILGYQYLNEYVDKYKDFIRKKDKKVVTVISQGVIGKVLSDIILEVATKLPDYHFQYKLHPGEYGRWKCEYPSLIMLSKLENVTIYEKEKPIYKMFAESVNVIGVSSTALFEGIAFNAKPLIIKLPSYEYMDQLKNQYKIEVVEDAQEVINYLTNFEHHNENIAIKQDLFYRD